MTDAELNYARRLVAACPCGRSGACGNWSCDAVRRMLAEIDRLKAERDRIGTEHDRLLWEIDRLKAELSRRPPEPVRIERPLLWDAEAHE